MLRDFRARGRNGLRRKLAVTVDGLLRDTAIYQTSGVTCARQTGQLLPADTSPDTSWVVYTSIVQRMNDGPQNQLEHFGTR